MWAKRAARWPGGGWPGADAWAAWAAAAAADPGEPPGAGDAARAAGGADASWFDRGFY